MKKTLVLSISVLLLLSTGCSAATNPEESITTGSASGAAAGENTVQPTLGTSVKEGGNNSEQIDLTGSASGAAAGENTVQPTLGTSVKEGGNNSEQIDLTVEEQVTETISDYYELVASPESKNLFNDLDAAIVEGDNEKSVQNMDKVYEKHEDFLNKLEQKISISTGESLMSANARDWGLSDRGIARMNYLNSASQISEIDGGVERGIPAIFPDSIIEENGEVSVLARHVYLKDENGAIRQLMPAQYAKFIITDGGKKLELAQSDEYARSVAKSFLESDTVNAAKIVETFAVRSGNTAVPLVVENGKIVPTEAMGNKHEYVLKYSPETNLKVEGTTFQYFITATTKGYDSAVIYDSQKGGLQKSDFMGYDKIDSYDAKLYRNYLTTVGNFTEIDKAVEKLNDKYSKNGTSYEIVEKSGERYIKVSDPQSTLGKNGELLYAFIPARY